MNRFHRATLAALACAGLLAGCTTTDAGGDAAGHAPRLRLDLTWLPKQKMSPYSQDAFSLTPAGIGETLVAFDGKGEVVPGLAKEYRTVDAHTVHFTLRDGVTFHDGTAADAAAVAASVTRMTTATPGPETLQGHRLTATALDAHTVQVTSTEADPALAGRFAHPSTVVLAAKAYADPATPDPMGAATGPFVLTALDGRRGMTTQAYPGYWGGTPKLAGVDVRFVDNPDARATGLRAGDTDVAIDLPISSLGHLGDAVVETTPTSRYTAVMIRTDRGVFADPGVRAAAAAALNPAPVLSGPFDGHGTLAQGLLPPAPWTTGRRAPQPRPATAPPSTPITIGTYIERPALPDTASVVADQLRKAGFVVEPPVVKSWDVIGRKISTGAYDVVVTSQVALGSNGDPVTGLTKFFGCTGTFNPSKLCDRGVDAALRGAARQAEPDRRRAATLEAERAVLSTSAVVPLVFEQDNTGHAPNVTGLASDMFGYRVITSTTAKG